MEMDEVKGIPYGVASFEEIRNENMYYVDKTHYLPMLEFTGKYLFLIRPRRFGKSVFISMMRSYYDICKAEQFDTLFDGLWIKDHPTRLRNKFQVIYFDFSLANNGPKDLEHNFNDYCAKVLDEFMITYQDYYDKRTVEDFFASDAASSKLSIVNLAAHRLGYPLYLIIDEYDNFTNVILSESGKEVFKSLTHASGFYREYFKVFKAMFNRVFLIGVSPVTLDDLSSGYNIDWNISNDFRFNDMLGFSETDVRAMFQYYQSQGMLEGNIDGMIQEMKPWYDNYCFSEKCLSQPKVFNCDMTLFYLRNRVLYKESPKDMVDKNIRTDYKKLEMLAEIDRGSQRTKRMSVIEEVSATGGITIMLKTSFPAEYIGEEDNFRSLLYYYGLLTIGGVEPDGDLKMVIPNNCVREQYWSFMRDYFQKSADVSLPQLRQYMRLMAIEGDWLPLVDLIAKAYRDNSSVRDSILGEHNLQGFFKAYLALNSFYLVEPEIELNYGYSDFFLLPNRVRYPEISHCYIWELKYARPTATDKEIAALSAEAEAQLHKYSQDKIVRHLSEGISLHLVRIIFRGAEMAVAEEVG